MGFNVMVYGPSDQGLERCKKSHQQFSELFLNSRGATDEEIKLANSRLSYTTNLELAVQDTDLINESVPEDIDIKNFFYTELAKVAPEKTIFTTNSSTTLPSEYANETERPGKFLTMHFANGIWDVNVGEVMGHADTDPEMVSRVIEFAKEIGRVPIPVNKEQNGYVLNSLLIPLLST